MGISIPILLLFGSLLAEADVIFNDILLNDKLLKSLPKVNVSKDFMYSLDKKIEDYKESNNRTWYNFIREFTFNIKPAPALSAACIAIVVCFSIVKIYDYDLTPNFLKSKHKYNIAPLNNYIAVNDSDSLNSLKDSLNHPNLLFGND